jgi:hypothetical protein
LADTGGLVAANEITIELDIEAMSNPRKAGIISIRNK